MENQSFSLHCAKWAACCVCLLVCSLGMPGRLRWCAAGGAVRQAPNLTSPWFFRRRTGPAVTRTRLVATCSVPCLHLQPQAPTPLKPPSQPAASQGVDRGLAGVCRRRGGVGTGCPDRGALRRAHHPCDRAYPAPHRRGRPLRHDGRCPGGQHPGGCRPCCWGPGAAGGPAGA